MILTILCSCSENNSYIKEYFGGKYDLPKNLSEAVAYIDTELSANSFKAYQQLIIENPQSFYYDFNSIEDAPHFEASSDGVFRIYRFNVGMHEDPPIFQFCNSRGKVVTTHLSAQPLYKEADGEDVTENDYKQGLFCANARILGQIEIDGVVTYIMFISDYINEYMRLEDEQSNVLCEFVTGMQLTETGYKYVNIFEYPSSGYIHTSEEDTYHVNRVRASDYLVRSNHYEAGYGDAWYDEARKILNIPHSVENHRETFNIQKWNESNQRFEPHHIFGFDYSPAIHKSLGYTYGLEIIMYFDDLIVRVDDDAPHHVKYEHSYKYSSWSKGKTMADTPDIILYGGLMNEADGTLHFRNDGYEYIVPCAQNRFNNKLIVKKNGKVVLTKEIIPDDEE